MANNGTTGAMSGPREEALARLAQISARELEPMLDDVQRPLAARFWRELWATVPRAAGPVLELREAR